MKSLIERLCPWLHRSRVSETPDNDPREERNEVPDAEDIFIPSSVTEQGAKAMKAEREAGAFVPIEDLEALADEWEDTAAMQHPEEADVFNARCDAWRKAADELRELIEEKEP